MAGPNTTWNASREQWHQGVVSGEGSGQRVPPHTLGEAKGVGLHGRDVPLDGSGGGWLGPYERKTGIGGPGGPALRQPWFKGREEAGQGGRP